jgi:LPPG:FO 2-phospho-L-lactate transferase
MAGEIVALAGGVGAARFLEGLTSVVPPERVVIVGNTGDDLELHGLYICPDLDTVAYTLSGRSDPTQGWGLAGDTFNCMEALARFTAETWFRLGDRDLATHLFRTGLLRQGLPLSEVTQRIARALGVRAGRLLPMTDERLRTRIRTDSGLLDFQVYFVERRAEDQVRGISFDGAEQARPAPGVLEAIRSAEAIIVCPSNPLISIGPILAVPGVREALCATRAPIAAISPIVGGRAIKGPAEKMMRSLGLQPSALQVAELYQDFVDVFVLDHVDEPDAGRIEALGMRTVSTDTIMKNHEAKVSLALATLRAVNYGL